MFCNFPIILHKKIKKKIIHYKIFSPFLGKRWEEETINLLVFKSFVTSFKSGRSLIILFGLINVDVNMKERLIALRTGCDSVLVSSSFIILDRRQKSRG